jgi:hypothetical protein
MYGREPHRLGSLLVLGGVVCLLAGCARKEDWLVVRLTVQDEQFRPEYALVTWRVGDESADPKRLPRTGSLPATGRDLASIYIAIDPEQTGERTLIVRGMHDDKQISEATAKINPADTRNLTLTFGPADGTTPETPMSRPSTLDARPAVDAPPVTAGTDRATAAPDAASPMTAPDARASEDAGEDDVAPARREDAVTRADVAPVRADAALMACNRPLPRDAWLVSASRADAAHGPTLAVDGDAATSFSTGPMQKVDDYFQIDLGTKSGFCTLVLDTGTNTTTQGEYPRSYSVELSDDGTTWSKPVASGTGKAVTTIVFEPSEARYVRITLTKADATHAWSIAEVRVLR